MRAAATLTSLGVDVNAVVVLLLAGIRAGVGAFVAVILLAVPALGFRVQLEGIARVLRRQIIAGDDGELDAADRVARAIAVLGVGRLCADIGWRWNRALAGTCRLGRGRCRGCGGSASGGYHRGLWRLRGRLALAERALGPTAAGAAAILVD